MVLRALCNLNHKWSENEMSSIFVQEDLFLSQAIKGSIFLDTAVIWNVDNQERSTKK